MTHVSFIDQFIELVGDLRSSHKNLILGDFNIHINDPTDLNASQLLDSIEALGLKQCINSPTHKNNNTLDLLMSDELSIVKPIKIRTIFLRSLCYYGPLQH